MTEMPDMREQSSEQLVDALGELNETVKKWVKQVDYIKAALKSRLGGGDVVTGHTYQAVVSEKARASLDTERIKLEMGQGWYEDHCKVTTFKQINVSRSKGD